MSNESDEQRCARLMGLSLEEYRAHDRWLAENPQPRFQSLEVRALRAQHPDPTIGLEVR